MFDNNNLRDYFEESELMALLKLSDYERALKIVTRLFKDKVDQGGEPYIGHLVRCSMRLEEECEKVAGLLHDTLEDTNVSYQDLLELGFSEEILDIVLLVTNNDSDTKGMNEEEKLRLYNEKIERIISSGNIYAIRLKEADMSDNYNLERMRKLPIAKQNWLQKKYGANLIKLRKGKEEIK